MCQLTLREVWDFRLKGYTGILPVRRHASAQYKTAEKLIINHFVSKPTYTSGFRYILFRLLHVKHSRKVNSRTAAKSVFSAMNETTWKFGINFAIFLKPIKTKTDNQIKSDRVII